MKIKFVSCSMGYSVFQVVQGLLIHPYQTMRQVVRERVFIWLSFSPVFLWIFGLAIWRILEVLLLRVIPHPNGWMFLALWFTTAIGMYQALLAYLLVRFLSVARPE